MAECCTNWQRSFWDSYISLWNKNREKKKQRKQIRSPLGAYKLFSPELIIKKRKTAKRFLLRIHLEINVYMKIMTEFKQKQIDRCRDAYYNGG